LLLEEKILGHESFGAARSEKFREGGQAGGKEEKIDFHGGECRAGKW
jgi:hypothetical protein